MLSFEVAIVALVTLLGFWVVDQCLRMRRGLRAIPRGKGPTEWRRFGALSAIAVAGSFAISGHDVPLGMPLRIFLDVVVAILTWKHATQDIDVVVGEAQWGERALLVVLGIVGHWYPLAWLPWTYLVLHSFGGWTHHGTLPLRIVMLFLGQLLFIGLPRRFFPDLAWPQSDAIGVVFLTIAMAIHASHYVIPAVGKMRLGPHWWSWCFDNKLHTVAAGAYQWGWARFLAESTAAKLVRVIRALDVPFQIVTLTFELGIVLALFHRYALFGMALGIIGMHVMIFLSTGILFWEWMILNVAFCGVACTIDPAAQQLLFSVETGLAVVVLVLAGPARNRIWKPVWLAWWDTPFTARVHWEVIGASGKRYELYNDFLCPHERLYGRVHGYFMVSDRVFTYHLGQVYPAESSEHHKKSKAPFEPYRSYELRDAVLATRGDPAALAALEVRYGAVRRDAELERDHVAYLKKFLKRVARGDRKHVFPRFLRWLKAPGGQFYYWGDLPAYRGQEPAATLVFRMRKRYFDGDRFLLLDDRVVREVDLSSTAARGADDPTPSPADTSPSSRPAR
jgi:hypothetical protein